MKTERRKSRRYAIAFAFGQDIADVEEYQSTRRNGNVPIYLLDGDYVIALRDGESAPSDCEYEWKEKGTEYGYRILWSE